MVIDFPHPICLIIYDHTKITSTQTVHYANTIHANLQLNVHMKLMPLSTSWKFSSTEPTGLANRNLQKTYNYNHTNEYKLTALSFFSIECDILSKNNTPISQ